MDRERAGELELAGGVLDADLYGPLLWPRLRTWQAMVVAGIGASLAVEAAQLLISATVGYTYRIADVDDVIINTIGVMVAYAIYRLGRENSVSSG